jgi:hypothetical protein
MAQLNQVGKYTCLYLPAGTNLHKFCEPPHLLEDAESEPKWSPPEIRSIHCDLNKLLRDMSEYHLTKNHDGGHQGDLLDHSLWTYYALINETSLPKIFQPWFIQEIPDSYYPVLQVAGLLHDIGKAGDLNTEYTSKPNHPEQSWFYFQNKVKYIWVNGDQIPLMDYLYTNCALNQEEWSLVGLIAALHYDLGYLFQRKLTSNQLIGRLKSYISDTHINFCPVMTFRLIRAVVFADVWSQRPVIPSQGFVQIDSDLKAQVFHNHAKQTDNWKEYFNEQKFAITKQLELQIENSPFCLGPIRSYLLGEEDSRFMTTRPINLMIFNTKNIENLLVDPLSPYISSKELDEDICKLITNKTTIELRKYFIRELIIEIEICSFPLAREAKNQIYHWYYSCGRNKLCNTAINHLIFKLKDYNRPDWSNDKIDMTIRRLSSPEYSLEHFIIQYDDLYYKERIKYLENEIQTLMITTSPLGFKYESESFETWDDLINTMSKDDSFKIPLLSPKGLLIIRDIFEQLKCRSYCNTKLDNLLNYIITFKNGLFDGKQNIYGIYTEHDGSVNIMYC